MFKNSDRALILAAHPDDECIGVGGTIAKLVKNAIPVRVVFMSDGVTSRDTARESVESRKKSAENSLAILGVEEYKFFNFPDNKFDSISLLDLAKLIEAEVMDFNPTLVFSPYRYDLNIDHQVLSEATNIAVRPKPGSRVRLILNYEVLSSTGWNFGAPTFKPQVFVDIDEYIEMKMSALRAYVAEIDSPPSARSLPVIEALAKYRGGLVGRNFAESFSLSLFVG